MQTGIKPLFRIIEWEAGNTFRYTTVGPIISRNPMQYASANYQSGNTLENKTMQTAVFRAIYLLLKCKRLM